MERDSIRLAHFCAENRGALYGWDQLDNRHFKKGWLATDLRDGTRIPRRPNHSRHDEQVNEAAGRAP